jgi:hypothetical protein
LRRAFVVLVDHPVPIPVSLASRLSASGGGGGAWRAIGDERAEVTSVGSTVGISVVPESLEVPRTPIAEIGYAVSIGVVRGAA